MGNIESLTVEDAFRNNTRIKCHKKLLKMSEKGYRYCCLEKLINNLDNPEKFELEKLDGHSIYYFMKKGYKINSEKYYKEFYAVWGENNVRSADQGELLKMYIYLKYFHPGCSAIHNVVVAIHKQILSSHTYVVLRFYPPEILRDIASREVYKYAVHDLHGSTESYDLIGEELKRRDFESFKYLTLHKNKTKLKRLPMDHMRLLKDFIV